MLNATRRQLLIGAAGLAAISSTGFARAQTPKRGGTLTTTWGGIEPPALFVPAGGGNSPILPSTKMLEQLLAQSVDLSFQPQLALAVEPAPDFKSYLIKLRPNVKWHDGKPMTSEDVTFSAMKYWKPISVGIGLRALQDAVAVDAASVRLVFDVPVPEFYMMSLLAGRQCLVLPKHIYDGSDIMTNPINNTPIGTGPFKYKEWVRGSHLELVRNDDYWAPGLPYLDRVVIRWWRDAAARSTALESGRVDFGLFNPVPAPDVPRFEKDSRFQVTTAGNMGYPQTSSIEFNTLHPIFGKVAVRQALQHAFDRGFIADTIYYGRATPAFGFVPPSNPIFYNKSQPTYPFDPAKAAKLLDAAGYPVQKDGKRFKMKLLSAGWYEENGPIGQYMRQCFEDIDIDVELSVPDRATSYKRIFSDYDFDVAMANHTGPIELVPQWTQTFTTDNIIKGAGFRNAARYSNPVADKLVKDLAVEVDSNKRLKIAHELQQIIGTDVPLSSTIEFIPVSIASKAVKNIATRSDVLSSNWSDIWLDR